MIELERNVFYPGRCANVVNDGAGEGKGEGEEEWSGEGDGGGGGDGPKRSDQRESV